MHLAPRSSRRPARAACERARLTLAGALALLCAGAVACGDDDATGGDGGGSSPDAGAGPDGAAGGDGAQGVCAPNATEPCACEGGPSATGGRRCAADGHAWGACECPTYGAEIAVRPGGDDDGPGTLAAPFGTLERARDEVQTRVAAGLPANGLVVWLQAGTYRLTGPFALGPEHSGSEERPVVWRGVPGDEVRVTGAASLDPTAFVPVPDTSPLWPRLDPARRAEVLQLDLGAAGVTVAGQLTERGFCGGASSGPTELFIDGARQPLARWPDADENTLIADPATAEELTLHGAPVPDVTGRYVHDGESDGLHAFARDGLVDGRQYRLYRHRWDWEGNTYTAWFLTTQASGYPGDADPWWYLYADELGPLAPNGDAGAEGIVTTAPPEAKNHGFAAIAGVVSETAWTYAGDRPARWADPSSVWFHGFWRYAWADCHIRAAAIDPGSRTVTLASAPVFGLEAGQPFYAYDVPEELTAPGEWWIDRAAGLLYVLPPAGWDGRRVELAVADGPLVQLSDARYVELRDLAIDLGRGALVRVDGGDHVALVGLSLRGAGTDAVELSGAEHRVTGCHVADAGAGGVRLRGGDRRSLTPGGHLVEQSRIHDFGRWEWTYRPGVSLDGVGHVVRHNLIDSAPHSAILYGGNEHLVERNDIHDVCRFSSDAGAIYAGRDWGARGNVIRHNFIHDVATYFHGWGVHGVYLDDCLSGVRVEGNVLYRISGMGIHHGGGRDDLLVNNVIARCGQALSADSRCHDWLSNGSPNDTPGDSWNLLEKLRAVGYQDEPWASRYPECAAIPDDWATIIDPSTRWLYPEGSVFARNVGLGNESWISASAETLASYAELADNLEEADPLFVDEAGGDLSLAPGSPAFGIAGFEAIEFGDIGIRP